MARLGVCLEMKHFNTKKTHIVLKKKACRYSNLNSELDLLANHFTTLRLRFSKRSRYTSPKLKT